MFLETLNIFTDRNITDHCANSVVNAKITIFNYVRETPKLQLSTSSQTLLILCLWQ